MRCSLAVQWIFMWVTVLLFSFPASYNREMPVGLTNPQPAIHQIARPVQHTAISVNNIQGEPWCDMRWSTQTDVLSRLISGWSSVIHPLPMLLSEIPHVAVLLVSNGAVDWNLHFCIWFPLGILPVDLICCQWYSKKIVAINWRCVLQVHHGLVSRPPIRYGHPYRQCYQMWCLCSQHHKHHKLRPLLYHLKRNPSH